MFGYQYTFGFEGSVLHRGTELVSIGVGLDRPDPSGGLASSGLSAHVEATSRAPSKCMRLTRFDGYSSTCRIRLPAVQTPLNWLTDSSSLSKGGLPMYLNIYGSPTLSKGSGNRNSVLAMPAQEMEPISLFECSASEPDPRADAPGLKVAPSNFSDSRQRTTTSADPERTGALNAFPQIVASERGMKDQS
jgi:hypothetical protein